MSPIVIAVVALVVVVVAIVAFLALRGRARAAQTVDEPVITRPKSPTAMTCPFCKREYDPAETDSRCPGCGATAPRRRA